MKVRYDFHTHSGLSPCADDDMTPVNVVGFAALEGLDMVAISDHNHIGNVKVAMSVGEAYGVTVVPAIEVQTSEDVHILCFFPTYEALENFYSEIDFIYIENKPEIFGNQFFFDDEDNVIATEKRLLLNSAKISCLETLALADRYGGIAIPAHVDREANGMVAMLGAVMDEFKVVEVSTKATEEELSYYKSRYVVIEDSDAHTLKDISTRCELDLPEPTAEALIKTLKGEL